MPDGFRIPEAEMTADPDARVPAVFVFAAATFRRGGSRKIQDDLVYRQAG
jgi:hypothetical protein